MCSYYNHKISTQPVFNECKYSKKKQCARPFASLLLMNFFPEHTMQMRAVQYPSPQTGCVPQHSPPRATQGLWQPRLAQSQHSHSQPTQVGQLHVTALAKILCLLTTAASHFLSLHVSLRLRGEKQAHHSKPQWCTRNWLCSANSGRSFTKNHQVNQC